MTNYGYIRVSTRDQNIDRQSDAFAKLGIEPRHIYVDRQSGKNFNRPAYRKLLRKLSAGDCLFILSIDRFGRDYDEIIQQWNYITQKRGADIIVLDMPLLDTRKKQGGLTGKFIANLTLEIMSYVAETERRFILKRQQEGIASAMERGVQFGRKKMDIPAEFAEVCARYRAGEISSRKAGEMLGVSHVTFLNWAASMNTDEDKED